VVSFTPRPLYPRERPPGTHCIGGWWTPETVWTTWRSEHSSTMSRKLRKYRTLLSKNRDSSVDIATVCAPDGRDSIPDRDKTFLSSSQRPGRIWGPPNLLSNGYQRPFPWCKMAGRMNMITHLHLVPLPLKFS
jgi:hypothetical protein